MNNSGDLGLYFVFDRLGFLDLVFKFYDLIIKFAKLFVKLRLETNKYLDNMFAIFLVGFSVRLT